MMETLRWVFVYELKRSGNGADSLTAENLTPSALCNMLSDETR
jgi:hypothetical protein